MTAELRDFLASDFRWQEVEPRVWKRTVAPGYCLKLHDTAAGRLLYGKRDGLPVFFLREVKGAADLEALVAVLGD